MKLGPCLYNRDEICRVKRMIDAGNVIDAVDYTPAIAAIELRWIQGGDRPNARIAVVGERDESFCQCLLDFASVTALEWLKRTDGPSAQEVASIAQAIAHALGADRRALVEINAPTPPPWCPVRVLAGTGRG